MAEKTGSKKRTAKPADAEKTASASDSRCSKGGQEILPVFLPVRSTDNVELVLTLCKSPFRVVVFLDDELKVDNDPAPDEVKVIVSPMGIGQHALHWAYLAPPGVEWETRSDVQVNDVTRFRQRKSSESGNPQNHSFLFLEVI
jgi:hypothetical protein